MAHEPEMTPVELELERALRSLSPTSTADGSAAALELAFALGQASMKRQVRRWRAGSTALAGLLLVGMSIQLWGAPSSPTAGDGVGTSPLPIATTVPIVPIDAATRGEHRNPDDALPPLYNLDHASSRFVASRSIERQINAWRQTMPVYDTVGPNDAGIFETVNPAARRRVTPPKPNSFDYLMELLSAGEQAS